MRIKNIKRVLFEDIAPEQYGFADYRGGTLTFALNVNSMIDKITKNKLVAFLKKTYETFMNKRTYNKKLIRLKKEWNKEFEAEGLPVYAWTISGKKRGQYTDSDGVTYPDETSFTIELGGVPSELLLLFAIKLCQAFNQETVFVEDKNKNTSYYVDGVEIQGNTPKEKIDNAKKKINYEFPFLNKKAK